MASCAPVPERDWDQRYLVFRNLSHQEYLQAHPEFQERVLRATVKNAGAINLLSRKQDPVFVTGFQTSIRRWPQTLSVSTGCKHYTR